MPPDPPRRRQPSSPGLPGVRLPPVDSRPPPDAARAEGQWRELAATEGRILARMGEFQEDIHGQLDALRAQLAEDRAKSLERDLDAQRRIADVAVRASTAVVAEKAPELRRHAMTGGALSATFISGIVAGVLIWLSQTSGCAPQKTEHEGRAGQSQQHEARR